MGAWNTSSFPKRICSVLCTRRDIRAARFENRSFPPEVTEPRLRGLSQRGSVAPEYPCDCVARRLGGLPRFPECMCAMCGACCTCGLHDPGCCRSTSSYQPQGLLGQVPIQWAVWELRGVWGHCSAAAPQPCPMSGHDRAVWETAQRMGSIAPPPLPSRALRRVTTGPFGNRAVFGVTAPPPPPSRALCRVTIGWLLRWLGGVTWAAER